ncbi:flagellar basal body protein FliL [Amycolatopsis albispora]|uniref:flagellar basal body protein FliL n=1 Tax=Amycolatopsis albispora TaxID=1804986 RepID=UPI000DE5287B|nr:flagellar basal body protein FliL [Amycolatopsis albispora]
MTSPGQGGQWPQQGGGGQHGQQGGQEYPQHPQQQYPPTAQQYYPQTGQQQYYAPQTGEQYAQQGQYQQPDQQGQYQQQYSPEQYYAQQQASGGYPVQPGGAPGGPGTPKRKKGLIIGLVIALVVAVGGGVTWFALAQSSSGGADTPTLAAQNLANTISSGDVVGLLGTLAPAEASLFTDPIEEAAAELKRLEIVRPEADPKALSGMEIKTEGLVFDEAQQQQVNDHLTITKLTAGKITVTADFTKVPLTKDFLEAALDSKDLPSGPETETIDIAEEVRKNKGEPVRIATVKVDDAWYPSLLYTIADYALLEEKTEWPAQGIAANGAGSSNDAVKELLQAALDADVKRVIELLPPDEMGALQDAGPAILEAAGKEKPSGVKVNKLETESSSVGGGTRATLTALELTGPEGEDFKLSKDNDCYSVTMEGRTERMCASELADLIESESDGSLPPAVKQALTSLGTGILKQGVGVITTEVSGKHYVSPIRTLSEQGMTILRSLQPGDIKALMEMAN